MSLEQAPFDSYRGEETPELKELKEMIHIAVQHMEFGDMLWIRVRNGDIPPVVDLLARFIYANKEKFNP